MEGGFKSKLNRVKDSVKKIVGLAYDSSFNKSFLLNECN